MDKEKIKKYIKDLEKWNRLDVKTLDYFFAKWMLIVKGKNREIFEELLEALNWDDQIVLTHVVDILGKIGNKQAIPYLEKLFVRKDLWGITVCSLGIALVRLEDKLGMDFLKEKITNPKTHRDVRVSATKALIHLRKKNVFEENEKIDFGGETMTPEWSRKLENLVNKLRRR